jgi:hypothetical protein
LDIVRNKENLKRQDKVRGVELSGELRDLKNDMLKDTEAKVDRNGERHDR